MNTPPTLLRPPLPSPLPPRQTHDWLSDSSPLLPIIYLLVLIGLVILVYAFFSVLNCPPNPFDSIAGYPTTIRTATDKLAQVVSSVEYNVAAHGSDSTGGGNECPVCLTAFTEGETIREVNACKHLFHGTCIEMWLSSHSNCPVCRAFIIARRSMPAVAAGEDDFRQGLPDSASLV